MRKFSFLLFSLFLLSSCSVKRIPVRGTYLEPPYQITTDKSVDQVWDKLIDMFAQRGLPIKIIDRSSGLIISDESILSSTTEDREGKLRDPNAFIVVPIFYYPGSRTYKPITLESVVTGEWNVRIKDVDGKTNINVNIVNVKYDQYDAYKKTSRAAILTDFQSTGVFENIIADLIK